MNKLTQQQLGEIVDQKFIEKLLTLKVDFYCWCTGDTEYRGYTAFFAYLYCVDKLGDEAIITVYYFQENENVNVDGLPLDCLDWTPEYFEASASKNFVNKFE